MNKEYKIKLDLNKKLYNKKMAFNQFDENVNDFYIEITKNNEVVKDLDKSIVTLVAIKPNGEVDAQFIEVKEGQIYADLKPSMCDLVGNYQAKAMIVLEGEIVTTDTINYSVNEDKIISRLNDDIVSDERFTLFTDALARLSDIEASEEQRQINEAERILAEENRKIEEAKRVDAELIRQHEEADRAKYDAIRESNENIRKQNESIRLTNETNRIDEEAKRVEEEDKRKLAEEERNANYNFMTEDEERRRSEANAHKEAEVLRVQAETNRVNEEAKRRTTEQARVLAENTRVSNENTRKANEETRQSNEAKRVEAETQRQNRYNSFVSDAEKVANDFEAYTNNAKAKEEERKSNELDRKSQEDRRISNEVERISNENTRKANEVVREKNETSRQNAFTNKVNEVDEKISELNTTKDNFVSSINTKVDNKISELDKSKSDMTNTVSNKIDEVENRFNALTSKQQQDAEVIDARDGETSLKARLDRDIEKAKQIYVNVEGSYISTDSSVGYAKDVEILGNTIQDTSNLADIRSVGDKVEGQELYEIPVLSVGKNLFDGEFLDGKAIDFTTGNYYDNPNMSSIKNYISVKSNTTYYFNVKPYAWVIQYDANKKRIDAKQFWEKFTTDTNCRYIKMYVQTEHKHNTIQLEEGTVATPYEPYQEDKLTILSPVQIEKVGDVADRIIEKDGVWGVEKNVGTVVLDGSENWSAYSSNTPEYITMAYAILNAKSSYRQKLISDKFLSQGDGTVASKEVENIEIHSNGNLYIKSLKSRVGSSLAEFKEWLKVENVLVKYQLAQPQFIPLPHDQQIKLITFANKTNISFLTEIEGTIKAQVPKSLGATVNTHTEQISNLNKELDRVKKLEESTVSTVETESDFTTVEATSNGYFEDVKLEGKTLVNLISRVNWGGNSNDTITYYATNDKIINNMSVTITNPSDKTIYITINYKDTNTYARKVNLSANETKLVEIKSNEFLSMIHGNISDGWTSDNKTALKTLIILEGDHTQNPPSYFEGLKSVGQSASEDGADEIVVSSVNNGNILKNEEFELGSLTWAKGEYFDSSTQVRTKNFIQVARGMRLKRNFLCAIFAYDKNKKFVKHLEINKSYYDTDIVIPNGVTYIKVASKPELLDYSTFYLGVSLENNNLSYKADKKRLLYYNNETQMWEKPILRQWDSIEKHADGKYYYHQRSGEVVLNGSEDWGSSSYNSTLESYLLFYWNSITPALYQETSGEKVCNMFSDKFKTLTSNKTTRKELINEEGISTSTKFPELRLVISKSKLSTQDIQGFKQWLQANNVTVVYQLAQEKVYECTNIDLITYANETNYIVECGAIAPKTTLKVHNNISNVVSLLQKKVSLLESNITSYMITQNRLMLASRYNADTVSFKVDVATLRNSFEYDNDLYELILNNILVGKDNYNREFIENLIIFYWMDFVISDEMYLTLFEIIEEQHNPKIIEEETPLI